MKKGETNFSGTNASGVWSQKAFTITKIYLRKLSLKGQSTRLVERVLHSIGKTMREQGQRKAINKIVAKK